MITNVGYKVGLFLDVAVVLKIRHTSAATVGPFVAQITADGFAASNHTFLTRRTWIFRNTFLGFGCTIAFRCWNWAWVLFDISTCKDLECGRRVIVI